MRWKDGDDAPWPAPGCDAVSSGVEGWRMSPVNLATAPDPSAASDPHGLFCRRPGCSRPVPAVGPAGGRPASYCSPACRRRAHEERKRAEGALQHWVRVLAQYEGAAGDDRPRAVSDPEWFDAAGALLLHARRGAEALHSVEAGGRARADALLQAADRLERLLMQ